MIDPISRLLAIITIENYSVIHEPKETDSELMSAYETGFRDALAQMKSALERMPRKTEWVSMTKRKPKEASLILASIDSRYCGTEEHRIIITRYNPKDECSKYITAWMKLPKPYYNLKKDGDTND